MIKTFKNTPQLHKFNPVYEYDIYEGQINVEGLADTILEIEKAILDERDTLATQAWKQLVHESQRTNMFTRFNLFKLDDTKFLGEFVKREVQLFTGDDWDLWGRCWANVMRKGEAFPPHAHCTPTTGYLSGNVCVQTNETSTYYLTPYFEEIYESVNKDGNITLFPSWLKHYTVAPSNDIERITLGFDLVNIEGYEKGIKDERKHHWEKLE